MRLASGVFDDKEELFWVSGHKSTRVSQVANVLLPGSGPWTMNRVLEGKDPNMHQLRQWEQWAESTGFEDPKQPDRLLAPVSQPGKIICVGLNYRSHAAESQMDIPQFPILFNKFQNAVVGSGATINPPLGAMHMDYEAELVIVMGRQGFNILENGALDYVLGYCNGNDLSARDLQFRSSQWMLGKTSDGFGPMGPYLVTRDEVSNPDQLEIVCQRNGVEVQHSNTRDMIFSCSYLVSYISRFMTLMPGDVIFTGTPEGVVLGHPEGQREWLHSGDQIVVSIEGLGDLATFIGDGTLERS
ncbi:MAG: fumarylacetoacetate hydrolase family protein [Sulfobacillus sp.]